MSKGYITIIIKNIILKIIKYNGMSVEIYYEGGGDKIN